MRCSLQAVIAVLVCLGLLGCETRDAGRPTAKAKSGPSAPAKAPGEKRCESADMEFAPAERPAAESRPMAAEATARPAAPVSGPADVREAPAPSVPSRPSKPVDRPAPPRQGQIQSGTLTAGSFDDHERLDDYRSFLSEAMQGDVGEVLPRLAIGQRVLIHVTGAGGRPVGDARVVVRPADAQQDDGPALLETTTGSDGRALFLTGLDGGSGTAMRVSVYAPGSSQPVTRVMQLDGQPWRIALGETAAPLPRRLDLALVVDTTGSMGDELEYLKAEIDSIAEAVHRMFPNVDQRYALVVYRDQGDEYVTRTFDFTGSLAEFRSTLAAQRAAGGGDYPEAVHLALASAARLDWRERETARVMFLVGDAPPHDRFAAETLDGVKALRARGVRVFPVAASGAQIKAEFVMRAAAFLTLGQYLFLTDHSGVGNSHAKPHVPSYQVERLDRLMVRTIASELAGRRLAPQEVIAIQGGASPGDLPVLPEQQQTQSQPPAPARAAVQAGVSWWPPYWVLVVVAIALVCAVDSVVDRSSTR